MIDLDSDRRGIRSSYQLDHRDPDKLGAAADVTEIATPAFVVIDGETGVLRAVWRNRMERVQITGIVSK